MLSSFYTACIVGFIAASIAFLNFKTIKDRLLGALVWFLFVTVIFFLIGVLGPKSGSDDFDGPQCAAYC